MGKRWGPTASVRASRSPSLLDGLSFRRTWPSASRQCESIEQQKDPRVLRACRAGHRKKIYLALALAYSASLLAPRACSAYGSSPMETSSVEPKESPLERTRDKNFFGFRPNIFPGWQALSRWSSTRGPYIETGAGVVHKRTRIYPMNLIWIFPIAFRDAAEPWQLGFQDPATPMMQGSATWWHWEQYGGRILHLATVSAGPYSSMPWLERLGLKPWG